MNYSGPRLPIHSNNLYSVRKQPLLVAEKLHADKKAGRIIGPFSEPPISNLRINPVGLIPKNTGGWRLITNLSFPPETSINDFIDPDYSSVEY